LGHKTRLDMLIAKPKRWLTQRAPDVWESARFQALCVA
jgi:hypothetical protein